MNWHIVTGEYPPQPGGVSDYTRVLAKGLVAAGDTVDVWAPESDGVEAADNGIILHRLPSRFGPGALRRLDRGLASNGVANLLIQYVPQAFGWKGMNLLFCAWLYARRRWAPIVMFHEVMYPSELDTPLRYRLLSAVSVVMASIVARASARIFVSSPIWQEILRTRVRMNKPTEWLPLPSTIPVIQDDERIAEKRRRYQYEDGLIIGHFSSYPEATRRLLRQIVPAILQANPTISLTLIGAASAKCREELIAADASLATRIHASGELPLDEISLRLSACDLMVQLYPDGCCARRTTLIAALAHGRAVVTTSGPATEPLWQRAAALALVEDAEQSTIINVVNELVAKPELRQKLGRSAARLYSERFELSNSIRMLRET